MYTLIVFKATPNYAYAYQISDDNAQTYIAHKENGDVSGQYRYLPF